MSSRRGSYWDEFQESDSCLNKSIQVCWVGWSSSSPLSLLCSVALGKAELQLSCDLREPATEDHGDKQGFVTVSHVRLAAEGSQADLRCEYVNEVELHTPRHLL